MVHVAVNYVAVVLSNDDNILVWFSVCSYNGFYECSDPELGRGALHLCPKLGLCAAATQC